MERLTMILLGGNMYQLSITLGQEEHKKSTNQGNYTSIVSLVLTLIPNPIGLINCPPTVYMYIRSLVFFL